MTTTETMPAVRAALPPDSSSSPFNEASSADRGTSLETSAAACALASASMALESPPEGEGSGRERSSCLDGWQV